MARPFRLSTRLFLMLVLAASLLGGVGLKSYEYVSYRIEREKLSVRIATASVRISKALIQPSQDKDIAAVRHILSAFAALPEVVCVNLTLPQFTVSEFWPYPDCNDQASAKLMHRQPIRRALKVLGHADIYFNDDNIEQEISNLLSWVAAGIAVLMLSKLAIIFGMNRYLISRPVSAIIEALDRLRDGDKSARIGQIKSSYEFSILANSYDRMAAEIAAQEQLQLKHTAKIDAQNKEIRQSLNYAALIQKGLTGLNPAFKDSPFDMAMCQKQLAEIGGDVCVGLDLKDRYAIFFADATGHGVPGALATMLLASSLRIVAARAGLPQSPEGWLAAIHENFIEGLAHHTEQENDVGLGADAVILILDKQSPNIHLASAKIPVFIKEGDRVEILGGDKTSIGYDIKNLAVQSHQFKFTQTDSLMVICTDGIFDQPDLIRRFGYGKRRLARLITDIDYKNLSADSLAEIIFKDVEAYAGGANPVDDRTVLVIRYNG